jgi:hypothetical protein
MIEERSTLSSSAIGRTLGVLRRRPFLLFWLGACISNTGNWTENAAQSWAVTSHTIGNPHQGLLVEILQFADFCPVLLLALLAGAISACAAGPAASTAKGASNVEMSNDEVGAQPASTLRSPANSIHTSGSQTSSIPPKASGDRTG